MATLDISLHHGHLTTSRTQRATIHKFNKLEPLGNEFNTCQILGSYAMDVKNAPTNYDDHCTVVVAIEGAFFRGAFCGLGRSNWEVLWRPVLCIQLRRPRPGAQYPCRHRPVRDLGARAGLKFYLGRIAEAARRRGGRGAHGWARGPLRLR